jgi:MarR family transcriptional regulator, transcriptional regulator for hemolysin
MARVTDTTPIDPTDDSPAGPDELAWLLRVVAARYRRAVRSTLAVADGALPQRGSWAIALLVEHPCTITELADEMAISKQAASQLVTTLEAAGMLERRDQPGDRRITLLVALPPARAAAKRIAAASRRVEHEFGADLGADRLADLKAMLRILARDREH